MLVVAQMPMSLDLPKLTGGGLNLSVKFSRMCAHAAAKEHFVPYHFRFGAKLLETYSSKVLPPISHLNGCNFKMPS